MLCDLRRSPVTLRHIEGIVGLDVRDAVIELPSRPFMTAVRGTELRMTLDEKYFTGGGTLSIPTCDRPMGAGIFLRRRSWRS